MIIEVSSGELFTPHLMGSRLEDILTVGDAFKCPKMVVHRDTVGNEDVGYC